MGQKPLSPIRVERIDALASFSLTKLQTEITTTRVLRLEKVHICYTAKSGSLHVLYHCTDAARFYI